MLIRLPDNSSNVSVYMLNNACRYQNSGATFPNIKYIVGITGHFKLGLVLYRTINHRQCRFCKRLNDLFRGLLDPRCIDCITNPEFNINKYNILNLDNSIFYYDSHDLRVGLLISNNILHFMYRIEININHQYKLIKPYEDIYGPGFCQKCYRRCYTFYCESCNKYFQLLMISENYLSLLNINNIILLPELIDIIKNLWFMASFCAI